MLGVLWGLVGCGQEVEQAAEEGEDTLVSLTLEERQIDAILDNPEVFKPVVEGQLDEEEQAPFVLNKAAQVSVLCYHDFHPTRATDMVMPAEKFRGQMEAISEAGIPVISMGDFLSWLRGEKNVPDPCVLITIDDGWKAVHSIAMPILSEHGFPFTVFLYKNYVGVGGRSLTLEEIEDLKSNGGEIGCHSVTHTNMASAGDRDEAEYLSYLHEELGASKRFLGEVVEVVPRVFAYPFGKYNDRVIEVAAEYDYEALFTVNGKRAAWEDPRAEIGRFVVHGDNDYNFDLATSFRGRGNLGDNLPLLVDDKELPFSISPAPEERVKDRCPTIRVDLSRMEEVIPESIRLVVGGFGAVRASYDAATRLVSYRVPQKLRNPECLVQFSVQVRGEEKPYLLPWRFHVDQKVHYLEGQGSTDHGAGGASGESKGRRNGRE